MRSNKISDFSEESSKRAEAAEQPKPPIEPEIVEESPEFKVDPAVMHRLMVVVVKGIVVRVDQMVGWKDHPGDDWCESTTQVVEILIEKYGGIGTSPEALLCFNLLVWIAPNLLMALSEKPKDKDAQPTPAADTPTTETAAAGPSEPVYTPDLSPFEDAVSA